MGPINLILHDEPAATRRLRASIDEVADDYALPGEARFELKLAATEALTNALRGSNGEPVHVRILPRPGEIEVEIADHGVFDAGGRADREGGRGIPLMLALVDAVEFSSTSSGTRVRVRKRIGPTGESDDLPLS
jgi:anti-sigma regulatory factor (Ser/Thr protein kinase)